MMEKLEALILFVLVEFVGAVFVVGYFTEGVMASGSVPMLVMGLVVIIIGLYVLLTEIRGIEKWKN